MNAEEINQKVGDLLSDEVLIKWLNSFPYNSASIGADGRDREVIARLLSSAISSSIEMKVLCFIIPEQSYQIDNTIYMFSGRTVESKSMSARVQISQEALEIWISTVMAVSTTARWRRYRFTTVTFDSLTYLSQ